MNEPDKGDTSDFSLLELLNICCCEWARVIGRGRTDTVVEVDMDSCSKGDNSVAGDTALDVVVILKDAKSPSMEIGLNRGIDVPRNLSLKLATNLSDSMVAAGIGEITFLGEGFNGIVPSVSPIEGVVDVGWAGFGRNLGTTLVPLLGVVIIMCLESFAMFAR